MSEVIRMIRNLPRNPTRALRLMIAGLSLFSNPLLAISKPTVTVQIASGDSTVFLEDTVRFQVRVNSDGLELWGFEFYLTVDPAIFEPILQEEIHDTTIIYRPFIPTTQLIKDNATPEINDTHGDVWSDPYPDPDQNGIPGFQMDFSHQAGVTPRKTFIGSGTAAYFDMVVRQFPDNPSRTTTITVDHKYPYQYIRHRECRYDGPTTGGYKSFPIRNNLTVTVLGLAIHPEIPDTVMTPGTDFRISLWDHFVPGLYDSSEVTWSISPNVLPYPLGANVSLVDLESPYRDSLIVTTTTATHGVVDLNVILSPNDGLAPDYIDRWVAIVDYPPVIGPSVPGTINFYEDDSTGIVASDLFTDPDDTPAEMTLWLDPDGPIHVNYDTGVDTVYFSADTNWYGTQDVRLYIQDMPGLSIDTLIKITVNAVNDTPVVNLDSVSALGDTLVIHRATPDTLDLTPFVTDVDNAVLTWSVSNPDAINLPTAAILEGNRLRLLAADDAAYVDINLILTATDAFGASASDTLVVSIRSWPPDIIIVEDIRINSQGSPYHLNLADWVIDRDTQPANMTWSFRAVDAVTGAVDPYVTFAPSNPLTGDTVNIGVTQTYAAVDLLEMTVTDDAYNTDIDTTRLFIFDGDAPMIYSLPGLTVYRNTTYAGIIDLDDYVVDLQDDPADITWTYTGGDSLASFYIDPYSHEVTIKTNTTFIGNLTVSLVATNSRGLRDTSDLAILVSRLVDGPPLWYAVPDEVEVVYGWTTDLFNYSQVCYDETPTDQIIFTPYYNSDSLTVLPVVSPDSVKLETPISDKKYTTRLYFSAEDELGNVSSSGTITVNVKDSFSPVWRRMPTIPMNVNETYSGLFLRDYVSDRDTPDNLLTITVVNNNRRIEVSYDSGTTELTVQAMEQESNSWLFITATDDKGNTATTLLHVIVRPVYDDIPPEGDLTYFFNPVADRRIHYVALADSTAEISRFIWHYSYGDPPRDYSDSLSFALHDTLPETLTWIAPYHFRNKGTYRLSVEITDASNNNIEPSPSLTLSVGFSKAMGDVLTSPDQQLTVSYPAAPIPAGKLLIIAEDSLPVSTGLSIAKTLSARGNEENGSQVPAMVYSLDTNLPEPILVTLTYHQKRDTDPYYSFYEVDGDQLLKIETYAGADGQFEAAVTLGKDVVFASSDTPARNTPLPDAELFCYPNPFNATIHVRFLLRWEDQGQIVIYNLLGREVYASPKQLFGPGVHAFSWHGIDRRGLLVPSGAYFIRLETDGGKVVTRKVTLLK